MLYPILMQNTIEDEILTRTIYDKWFNYLHTCITEILIRSCKHLFLKDLK